MSKEIFLYSEDNKYKCAVELADSLDRFNCPDHSVILLFEEREDGTYIIAQSRDKRLETEKDKIISDLEAKLAEKEKEIKELTECNQYLQIYRNQDKISFAIDELVKVKNFVNYTHFDFVNDCLIERFEVEKKIDNQIEELKNEKV